MIEFEHVSLTLGIFQLQDVSLQVQKGDYYFIIGPSGAGKTVILEAIAGLHHPQEGRILLHGKDARFIPPEKRCISLVYQDYSLFPHMTVFDNIAFGMRIGKKDEQTIHSHVTSLMELFQIVHLQQRYPLVMSGGEQQRVALARALAPNPDILLLDEPFSALDPVTREQIIADLRLVHAMGDLTIVQVTHARTEAVRLATRIAVVKDGRIVSEQPADIIFSKPQNADVARFIGIENVLRGVIVSSENQKAVVDIGGITLAALSPYGVGEQVAACIRAEDIILSTTPFEHLSARNKFNGVVLDLESLGPVTRVTIDCGVLLVATVLNETVVALGIKKGMTIYAGCKATAVYLTHPRGLSD